MVIDALHATWELFFSPLCSGPVQGTSQELGAFGFGACFGITIGPKRCVLRAVTKIFRKLFKAAQENLFKPAR